jgi:hypothetical protein
MTTVNLSMLQNWLWSNYSPAGELLIAENDLHGVEGWVYLLVELLDASESLFWRVVYMSREDLFDKVTR